MDKKDIEITDLHRLLIGDNPWGFTLEVFLRTVIIYLILVVVMRLLGKRMNAQLTILDLAVMLTLGAIASVPMQAFDRGILPGIILLISILLLHQGSTYLSSQKRKAEFLTQGKVSLIIKNGVLDPEKLKDLRISKDQLFALLRNKGVRHLGEVKRFYSEADGEYSLYRHEEPKEGLDVLPRSEDELPQKTDIEDNALICTYCGYPLSDGKTKEEPCPNCGNKDWIKATN